jgi:3-deoxy-D-manno-octulosonate 8-phosphate phosphatase (KDO 8-P phosphatase)
LSPELSEKLRAVRLAVFDVDGTLTEGAVTYAEGLEIQRFCVRDGQGLVWLRRLGITLCWISGRGCEATRRRAQELGVEELHLRAGPKAEVLAAVQERLGLTVEQTLAMGDDLPDLGLFERAAVCCSPADAAALVRGRADIVTEATGGHGAVREVVDALIEARGAWSELLGGTAR